MTEKLNELKFRRCQKLIKGKRVKDFTILGSARVVKTPMGYGTPFHADVRRDRYYTCQGVVYAKIFYWGMVFPLNSSSLLILGRRI